MPTPSVSCFVYSRFPNQISASISCSVLPTRDFSSRWEIITRHVKGHSDYSPSINAHNWTVSDHQWSEALKLRIGFTLRMRNCVSSSWIERLRISDRKFVNHTTEMILWSMILEMAVWAVDANQGQPRKLVLMEFCSLYLERGWALFVGSFRFRFGVPWLKKPSQLLLHKLRAEGFRSNHQSR